MLVNSRIFKVIILFILPFLASQTLSAQRSDDTLSNIKKPSALSCNSPSLGVCNLIQNNTFNSSCFGLAPFGANCVNFWTSSHGTPQLNVWGPLHISGANHASMWAVSAPSPQGNQIDGEGIATGIHPLTIGNKYSLSLFKKYYSNPSSNFAPDVDNFYVVLLKCADFLALQTSYFPVPQIPPTAQIIYCEHDMSNTSWERINQCFVASDEYDVVWIFPQETTIVPGRTFQTWLEVTLPEIVDVSGFSAGPNPTVTYPNCNVTIGPNTPNCGVSGAIFTWYDPAGLPHAASPNQTITVNAAVDYGTWTLKMTVPNIVSTNNVCSQNCSIEATVDVPQCINCPTPAQILTTSFFDPSCNNPHQPIVPYTLNYYCLPWECGGFSNLESNYATGNKWYINGIPIPDNHTGSIPGIGIVWISNNSKNLQHSMDMTITSQLFNFQLKNENFGCGQLTQPTYVYYGETLFPNEDMGFYKPNYTRSINIPFGYTVGSGSIYTWSIPSAIVTDVDNTTPDASVYFPTTIPLPTVYGTLTVTNSPYCNGTYNIFFTYNPQLRPGMTEKKRSINIQSQIFLNKPSLSNTRIFPNPVNNQLRITSNESITDLEIFSFMNLSLRKVQINGSKSITLNVSDLKSGVYNCRITTNKGIENQKVIIKR